MHMSAGHGGPAAPGLASGDRKALVASGLLTGVYFVVELGVGLWSGSVAVTSDAFHTFSAVGGVLIALVAHRLSERPASWEHTFGWGVRRSSAPCSTASFWLSWRATSSGWVRCA